MTCLGRKTRGTGGPAGSAPALAALALSGLFMVPAALASEGTGSPRTARCPDVALVLAIDASGSIDDREFRMQQTGYATAFRNDAVQIALRAAGIVDVAAVIWGDSDFAPQIVPFHRIATTADAEYFAGHLQSIGRGTTGNTGLGAGMDHALDLLEPTADCATRRIIDVSGDGRQVYFRGRQGIITPAHARARADAMGVTINGLAIVSREPDLEDYYRSHVITGASAFVIRAEGFHDFGTALIDKLVRELMADLSPCGEADAG